MTYLATAANPQLAAKIQAANPGSQIVPQNGVYHIYTSSPPPKIQNKGRQKVSKKIPQKNTLDSIPWWILAAAIVILLFSIM